MKNMKKIMAAVLALVLALAMGTALAEIQEVNPGLNGPGSITIENAEIGETYKLYKLFDATVSLDGTKIAYKLPSGKTSLGTGTTWFDLDSAGNISAKDGVNGAALRSDEFIAWASGFGAQIGGNVVANKDQILFKNIPFGYYFVESSVGAILTVDSTKPDVVVHDKNQTPPPPPPWDSVKRITENGQKVKVNEANLNEDIEFDIGVLSKRYDGAQKIYSYIFEDTIDPGMTYRVDTDHPITVSLSGPITQNLQMPANWQITYYTNSNFTTTTDDVSKAQAFRLSVTWTDNGQANGNSLYPNDSEIHVKYYAFLDPAKTGNVKYNGDPNKNRARVRWLKGPDPDDPGKDPEGSLPWAETETYITEIQILKTDGTNALQGAEFTLTGVSSTVVYTEGVRYVADANGTYWKLKGSGGYTNIAPTTQGINTNRYESTTQKYRQETFKEAQGAGQTNVNMKAFVDPDGKLTFHGLGEGTYTITESVVPEGYNKAADISFKLTFNPTAKTWSVSNVTGGTITGTKTLATTIVNRAGVELPQTGGIGTTIFYAVGSVLLLGAAVLLVTRRRMKTEK